MRRSDSGFFASAARPAATSSPCKAARWSRVRRIPPGGQSPVLGPARRLPRAHPRGSRPPRVCMSGSCPSTAWSEARSVAPTQPSISCRASRNSRSMSGRKAWTAGSRQGRCDHRPGDQHAETTAGRTIAARGACAGPHRLGVHTAPDVSVGRFGAQASGSRVRPKPPPAGASGSGPKLPQPGSGPKLSPSVAGSGPKLPPPSLSGSGPRHRRLFLGLARRWRRHLFPAPARRHRRLFLGRGPSLRRLEVLARSWRNIGLRAPSLNPACPARHRHCRRQLLALAPSLRGRCCRTRSWKRPHPIWARARSTRRPSCRWFRRRKRGQPCRA